MFFAANSAAEPRLPFYKTFLCITCVLILIVNGFSLLHNLASLKGANTLLTQSARVGDRLQYLNVLIMDAESSLRGYFVSGNEVYLGPVRSAPLAIDSEFKELDSLLIDSPSQQKNLVQLRAMVNRKISRMNELLAVYQQGGLDDIVKIAKVDDGRAVMDEIRLQVVIMVKEQNETLDARGAAFYQEYQKAVLLGIGINAMAILVLALFYRLIRNSFFTRIAVERALQEANDNLESTVGRRTEQLSVLSHHLIKVSEEEKASLARELHDELGANLTALHMDLGYVLDKVGDQADLRETLQRARATLRDTVELKRRIVENLRPSLLDNLGLAPAIHSYCEQFAAVCGLACAVDIEPEVDTLDFSGTVHIIAVFRIVQESLNNIAKYAKAGKVTVRLRCQGEALLLQVIDDGVGISPDALVKPKAHGLLGMRERALLLGGSLQIRRGENDRGTCIEALIPLLVGASAANSGPHPTTDGHIPSLPPYSIHPHSAPDLSGR